MRDKILEIHQLMLENPAMPVKLFVGSDELCEDNFYTSHVITSVEISEWCEIEEHIFIDEDELSEYYMEMLGTEEKEARKMAVENLINVILIKTGA